MEGLMDTIATHGHRAFLRGPLGVVSYDELRQRILDWQERLQAVPPSPLTEGPRLALLAEPSFETIVLMLALLAFDVRWVAIHPQWSMKERDAVLKGFALDRVETSISMKAPVDAALATPRVVNEARPGGLVMMTSGTTGRKKGAVLGGDALRLSALAVNQMLGLQANDRWGLSIPLAHIGGLSVVLRCVAAGASVVLSAEWGPFDPQRRLEEIVAQGTTRVSWVPTMLHRVMNDNLECPSTLKTVMIGGAPVATNLVRTAMNRGFPVVTSYGLTETCAAVTLQQYPGDGSVGVPIGSMEVRILNEKIWVRGPHLMDGYLTDGQLVRPFPDGWFDTGDRGVLDEASQIYVRGRGADLIITGGENVYPAEVEAVLLEHPDIEEASVIGVPDDAWGQNVVACLVAKSPKDTLRPVDVGDWMMTRTARFACPKQYVWMEALPKSASGKVDREVLALHLLSSKKLL
jgi:o-succinylbenzoate---CoA ligase